MNSNNQLRGNGDFADSKSLYSLSIFPDLNQKFSDLEFNTYLPLYKSLLPASSTSLNTENDFKNTISVDSTEAERRLVYYFKQLLDLPLNTLDLEPTLINSEIQRNHEELSKLLYTEYSPLDSVSAKTRNLIPLENSTLSSEAGELHGNSSGITIANNSSHTFLTTDSLVPQDPLPATNTSTPNSVFVKDSPNFLFLDIFSSISKAHSSSQLSKTLLADTNSKILNLKTHLKNVSSLVSEIEKSRKLSRRLVENQDLILQLASLPDLMNQYIRSGKFVEVMEIHDSFTLFAQNFFNNIDNLVLSNSHDGSISDPNLKKDLSYSTFPKTTDSLASLVSAPSNKALSVVKAFIENILRKIKTIFNKHILMVISDLESLSSIQFKFISGSGLDIKTNSSFLSENHTPILNNLDRLEDSQISSSDISSSLKKPSDFSSRIYSGTFFEHAQKLPKKIFLISILRQSGNFSKDELKLIYLHTLSKSWQKYSNFLGFSLPSLAKTSNVNNIFSKKGYMDSPAMHAPHFEFPASSPLLNKSSGSLNSPFTQKSFSKSTLDEDKTQNDFLASFSDSYTLNGVSSSLESYLELFADWIINLYNEFHIIFPNTSTTVNSKGVSKDDITLKKSCSFENLQCPLIRSFILYYFGITEQLINQCLNILSSDETLLLSLLDRCSWVSEKLSRVGLDFLWAIIVPHVPELVVKNIICNTSSSIDESEKIFLDIHGNIRELFNLNEKQQSSTLSSRKTDTRDDFSKRVLWHRLASSNRVVPEIPSETEERLKSGFMQLLKLRAEPGFSSSLESKDILSTNSEGSAWDNLLQEHSVSGVTILQYPVISVLYHAFRKATLTINQLLPSSVFSRAEFAEKELEFGSNKSIDSRELVLAMILIIESKIVDLSKTISVLFDELGEFLNDSLSVEKKVEHTNSTLKDSQPDHHSLDVTNFTKETKNKSYLLKSKKVVSECAYILYFGVLRYLSDFFGELVLSLYLEGASDLTLKENTTKGTDSLYSLLKFDFEQATYLLAPSVLFYIEANSKK
ncbi:hypothetical protein BB560_006350 [Smittium megazygosporum]|uniref:Uncharacterized protein n=1 Tax=Smittium megazygosporum TaxID=133381 RepID=A0A2T9Y8N4_9FUNG|nr:hypothetical protein BB560_006350 [Smittium megazygosporum]